jgi:hypothetical protein
MTMSVLDLFIVLIAVLIYLALHMKLAFVVVGTLVVLILVRLFAVGEPFYVRRA